MDTLALLLSDDFINRTAAPGMPDNRDGMKYFFSEILRPAFPDLQVEIIMMVAEGDKVVTRKLLKGTHNGPLMGIAPTGKSITIGVIDIFTVADGQLKEHWGETGFAAAIAALQQAFSLRSQ